MVLFYAKQFAKKSAQPTACRCFTIQDLDYQGLGVAKMNGKTWFVENALPNEQVDAVVIEEKRHYGRAQAVRFKQKSANRQTPSCSIYADCGGCQMQHISLEMQRTAKQNALFQRLQRLQGKPIDFHPMIVGSATGYRRRAKLHIGVEKNGITLGFRQANSQQIVAVAECEMLEPALSVLLPKLQHLLSNWKRKKQLGHLELVQADNGICLLFRHIGQLNQQDSENLRQFAETENLSLFVMTEKDQVEQWRGEPPYYHIDGLKLAFSIRDFIQVNAELNAKMVETSLNWLDLQPQDRVLDLFCGMGNFTLPMAKRAAQAVGIEGVSAMVEQAKQNAVANGIPNAQFFQADLDQPFVDQPWAAEKFNKVLLDPSRNGAWFALDHLCQLQPERMVYVSCNPATLVRDAEKLIDNGYRLTRCAMIDMFPNTAHLESISLFEKG
ncbi:23S rRNA methyltransferase [Pasteurellaceae bacterium Orientalotternb1]|nr:23S rRNA methyltransferase [Pasteurellaceae bacterium Orientalotternb1]